MVQDKNKTSVVDINPTNGNEKTDNSNDVNLTNETTSHVGVDFIKLNFTRSVANKATLLDVASEEFKVPYFESLPIRL